MEEIVEPLLKWYDANKRKLPWRDDKDPYHVWVSEIMLQQTRIEAVIQYYQRFMESLPTIESLANANLDELFKLWEGLGYYNRVKNMQKAAQIIVNKYNGCFPPSYLEILSLPGIGEYTASAIASICFDLKEATVDGNVLRLYMRIHNCYDNIDDTHVKKEVRKKLIPILPNDSGNFNEAMMELGEKICLPNGLPKCDICPIRSYCKAYQQNSVLDLPIRKAKKEKKEELYTVFLWIRSPYVAISKRTEAGLLHNLWQFPNISGHLSLLEVQEYLKKQNISYLHIAPGISYTHVFTHKKWKMISYIIEIQNSIHLGNVIWVTKEELNHKYAIPSAFQPFKSHLESII